MYRIDLCLYDTFFPLTLTPQRRLSDDELRIMCELNEAWIERNADGTISIKVNCCLVAGSATTQIYGELLIWTRKRGGGRALLNQGFRLRDGSMFGCPAAWISEDRWGSKLDTRKRGFPKVCPEFVVEVTSQVEDPSNTRSKMGIWIDNGVEIGWLLDTQHRNVEIHRADRTVEILEAPLIVKGDGPVAGFEFEMTKILGWTSSGGKRQGADVGKVLGAVTRTSRAKGRDNDVSKARAKPNRTQASD